MSRYLVTWAVGFVMAAAITVPIVLAAHLSDGASMLLGGVAAAACTSAYMWRTWR